MGRALHREIWTRDPKRLRLVGSLVTYAPGIHARQKPWLVTEVFDLLTLQLTTGLLY